MVESLQAWDAHADTEKGHVHFQVIVKVNEDEKKVLKYALKHLELEDVTPKNELSLAKLGHTQGPQENQTKQIADVGYAIFKVHPAAS